MKVWIRIPFSVTKNLGKAYNQEMEMIPDSDACCFVDGDVCFLTPDFGSIIHEYANKYPNAVLTCWTNRIHLLARGQLCNICLTGTDESEISSQIRRAEAIRDTQEGVTQLNGPVSGFLLVVPKLIWKDHKFTEVNRYRPDEPNLLGCDNAFTNDIRNAGVPILRMNRLLVWHSYRLLDGSKKHLL